MKPPTETDLEEIEHMARENAAETYRGPLLALVDEVRRLREIMFEVAPGKPPEGYAPVMVQAEGS